MRLESTPLEGCFLIHDTFFGDSRGYFFESFNRKTFLDKTGLDLNFVQDNQSNSLCEHAIDTARLIGDDRIRLRCE